MTLRILMVRVVALALAVVAVAGCERVERPPVPPPPGASTPRSPYQLLREPTGASIRDAKSVAFCDLADDPSRYHGAVVRVAGILYSGETHTDLTDPGCQVGIHVWFWEHIREDSAWKRFKAFKASNGEATFKVSLVGELHSDSEGRDALLVVLAFEDAQPWGKR